MPATNPPRSSLSRGQRTALLIVLPCWLYPLGLALAWSASWRGFVLAASNAVAAVATWWLVIRPGRGGRGPDRDDPPTLAPLLARSPDDSLTRSGFYDSPVPAEYDQPDSVVSGTYSIIDMVNRLEPEEFRWVQSSLAEQQFLGWPLESLRTRSFLDIVEASDRPGAERALRLAVKQGEYHGLVVRIRTARGKSKAIEVHASARYSADQRVAYLRCLLTDVTERLRVARERELRNQELSRVNAQLRQINQELGELKDRYSDLYENAPAMYFSLDARGRLVECNATFLKTLDRHRGELIGRPFDTFLDPSELDNCRSVFGRLLETGSIETESRWVKASGEVIDVWVSGTVPSGPRGDAECARCVAQDVTAKHRLEAELRATNRSLALANAELSSKNRELDDFVYVVSHDLQEPIRTLIGFSNFLLEDCVSNMDDTARDHVQRLSAAAHRMRAMIQGLLTLSQAGRVIEEPVPVVLTELVDVVKADLGELIRTRSAEIRLAGPGVLYGDRRRLQQLLTNLIGNAIKYNRSDPPLVEVGIEGAGDKAPARPHTTLYVRDNGIGIEPKYHQKIFQLFRRLHHAEEFPGTGAGLAICKKIVHAHGGEICLESRPGQGATFFVSLPSGPATPPQVGEPATGGGPAPSTAGSG